MLRFILILFDFLTATLTWSLFYIYRKLFIEKSDVVYSHNFIWGVLLIPFLWVLIYHLQGTYHATKRLHRAKILNYSLFGSLFGTIVLFFLFILDDKIDTYKEYYQSLLGLFIIHFVCISVVRYIIVAIHIKRVKSGRIGFKTIIVGGGEKALAIYKEIVSLKDSIGNDFVGYIQANGSDTLMESHLKRLGGIEDLRNLLQQFEAEEVIIALEGKDLEKLKKIVSEIYSLNIVIKVLPDMYDILSGSVKMVNIFGVLLVELEKDNMPYWQIETKRLLDVLFSLIAVLILLPIYLILGLIVKLTSKGPIFFLQERVGLGGKVFNIIKFRTMYVGSEATGPRLSSDSDARITSSGKYFRKLRLDELPQFINVLKGDMSLVGPRPERQFFINQIIQKDPQYLYLNSVRPGITSWGQVKFGYAENVDQMLQRMKYDLLYLKNRSLALDFKIMVNTVLIVLKAKGK